MEGIYGSYKVETAPRGLAAIYLCDRSGLDKRKAAGYFYNQTPENGLLSAIVTAIPSPPPGTEARKAPKPPLA
jgi:hypothetical protein